MSAEDQLHNPALSGIELSYDSTHMTSTRNRGIRFTGNLRMILIRGLEGSESCGRSAKDLITIEPITGIPVLYRRQVVEDGANQANAALETYRNLGSILVMISGNLSLNTQLGSLKHTWLDMCY